MIYSAYASPSNCNEMQETPLHVPVLASGAAARGHLASCILPGPAVHLPSRIWFLKTPAPPPSLLLCAPIASPSRLPNCSHGANSDIASGGALHPTSHELQSNPPPTTTPLESASASVVPCCRGRPARPSAPCSQPRRRCAAPPGPCPRSRRRDARRTLPAAAGAPTPPSRPPPHHRPPRGQRVLEATTAHAGRVSAQTSACSPQR